MLLNVHYSSSVRSLCLDAHLVLGVCQVCVSMDQEELITVLYLALLIFSYQFTLLSHRALHQSVK